MPRRQLGFFQPVHKNIQIGAQPHPEIRLNGVQHLLAPAQRHGDHGVGPHGGDGGDLVQKRLQPLPGGQLVAEDAQFQLAEIHGAGRGGGQHGHGVLKGGACGGEHRVLRGGGGIVAAAVDRGLHAQHKAAVLRRVHGKAQGVGLPLHHGDGVAARQARQAKGQQQRRPEVFSHFVSFPGLFRHRHRAQAAANESP